MRLGVLLQSIGVGQRKYSSADPRLGAAMSGVSCRTTRLPMRLNPMGMATYCFRCAAWQPPASIAERKLGGGHDSGMT
jgi:hypothetical protein